jgi:2-polyprenyl-3-methyl-5-hydroxy-6-metoxy-1,4-benzoquinol methylase
LVAIASFGEKNIELLRKVIRTYHSMAMDVDVIVLSEAPKNLGPGVEVVVGLPSKNPWSLPFAHKAIFAENVDRYDLFAYSEDDMEITEANIQAFLRVTPHLAVDEIAGFLRYEVDASGTVSFPDVYGFYHWRPESVRRRGTDTVAEFTNEHAAFFLITRSQLQRAIASRGFLREPCAGWYDMLCTAATDPYTNCGLRKVICISQSEHFLIHHLSNRYAGHIGLPLAAFKAQVQTLMKIGEETHPVSTLCQVESKVLQGKWSKSYYEPPAAELLELVPIETKTLLSIGCGWGAIEAAFVQRGVAVTALPLDSVIGAAAAGPGIEMLYAALQEAMGQLKGRHYDAILLTNLLHLLNEPFAVMDQCAQLLRPGGVLVMASPNFDYLPVLARRILGVGDYQKLRSFSQSGLQPLTIGQVVRGLRRAGFDLDLVRWQAQDARFPLSGAVAKPRGLGALLHGVWRSVRRIGLGLNAGRFLAPNWNGQAIKRR